LDYGCVVIHVFTSQARDFYKLERLWSGNEIKFEGGTEE
jgi:ribosomal silencing factor RsfS